MSIFRNLIETGKEMTLGAVWSFQKMGTASLWAAEKAASSAAFSFRNPGTAGAIAGGIYGYATSNEQTKTGKFRDTLLGAATLGGISAGITAARAFKVSGFKALGSTAGASLKVGKWAMRNPRSAIALAGAGMGMVALAGSGTRPAMSTSSALSSAAITHGRPSTGFNLGQGGNSRQEARDMWMNSTMGLVNGLHKGRH